MDESSMLTKWIAPVTTLFLALLGGAIGYGRTSQRIKSLDKAVHLNDGKWRFATAEDVCKKLDGVEKKIDDMQAQHSEDMRGIAKFMGQVEEHMKKNGG